MLLPRASRLATMALGLSFAAACSSATVPDAGSPDAAPRPDAVVVVDTGVTPADTGIHPDAGEVVDTGADLDSGFPDAVVPPDDAGQADSGPGDAGPCGPLDPAQGPARVVEALGAWVARCNPELTANEAASIGAFISFVAAPAFENTTLTYDAAAAGQCGCAIAAAPCDNLAWLRAIPSCDAAFVSTATTGDPCSTDLDCPTRHHCEDRRKDVAFGGRLPPVMCGQGQCHRFVGLGEVCGDAACAPGTYCDGDQVPPVCAANAALGEDCSNRPCVGDEDQVFVLAPNACYYTKGPGTCMARGRAGGTCGMVECHDLYRCDNNLDCNLMPGEGDACVTPFEPNPSLIARELQIHESRFACRGNIGVGLGAASYCVPTSTTTDSAVCRMAPQVGEPCGIGANLSPLCAPGAYCPGVAPGLLAPVSSLCIPSRTETSTCSGRPLTTYTDSQECELGTTCQFDAAAGVSRCADECAESNGGS